MIYIDPPYNTGNDFIYKDDYREPLESYLQRSGQMTDAGELLSSNPKASGRFHSNWMNMIYPRLRVAKDLLSDDGVIFVSIDDNEVHNLQHLMNEIFGEENFLANIIWERSFAPVSLKKHFSENHDFVISYAKSLDNAVCNGLQRTSASIERYQNPDNDPRGVWQSDNLSVAPVILEKVYPIITPNGREVMPPSGRCWVYTKQRLEEMIADNRISFGSDGGNVPRVKRFLSEVKSNVTPFTIWKYTEVGHSQEATQSLKKLFEGISYFDFPKPVNLIKRCLELYSINKNDIILDFFSGSATTAHAVMQLNAEDGGNRQFIMVQLPEAIDQKSEAYKVGYKTIAEIGKERIRRAIKKIKSEQNGITPLLQQTEPSSEKQDLGFKVFRLERSNFRAWTDFTGQELADFRPLLEAAETPFVAEAVPEGILTEILLLEGFPLNSKVDRDNRFERNKVFCVASEFSEHRLFVCFDEEVWEETIDRAGELDKNDIFICLDNALGDENKVRLADVCRLKTI